MDCKTDRRVDLHVHSTASDGTLTPHELLNLALHSKLAALSITDHDTLAGVKEALDSGIPDNLEFITGIEISTAYPDFYPNSGGSLHILGYGVDIGNDALNRELAVLQQARKDRNPAIIRRLNDMGIDLSIEDAAAFCKDGTISRPHIAQALKEKGFVKTVDEAFKKYIGNNGPAYADKYRIPCRDAIALIREAGGVPVMAHPGILKQWDDDSFINLVSGLKKMGLIGLEALYSRHSGPQTEFFTETARKFGLLLTGGTDFHGSVTPDLQLGTGKGDLCVPYTLFQKLKEYRTNYL